MWSQRLGIIGVWRGVEDVDATLAKTIEDLGYGTIGLGGSPGPHLREAEALLENLREAGTEPPAAGPTPALRLLVKRGDAVELGGSLFAAREAAESVLERIKTICREEGEITLAGLRDSLATSRKFAQAWLEYSDAAGVTSRTGDVRVLTRRHR